MALDNFRQKLKDGYWTKGSIWEFDWYLDVFFAEEMSFGRYPFYIGYEQPIVGDEYLDFAPWDRSLSGFGHFFEDPSQISELIAKQDAILASSNRVILELKSGQFNAEQYELVQRHLALLMASVSVVIDNLIPEQIKKISEREGIEESKLFGFVIDQSSHTKLNESNVALQEISKKSDGEAKKLLKQHSIQYGWLNTGEKGSAEWTAGDFFSQMKSLASVKKGKITKNEKLVLKNTVDQKLVGDIIKVNLNDNLAADKQIELDFLFQRYLRSKLGNLYKETILENLTYEEILRVIDNPRQINSFLNRSSNIMRAIWPENGKVKFYYFNSQYEFDALTNLVINKQNGTTEIRGSVACKGKVRGRVRIVETQADLESFEEGEVLVAVKTQPKYVPIMTRSAAIVTDIGGITSHAAIISREFEIPCIVGTGNATKMLKNGDLVLVDADLGVVTKL